MNSFIITLSLLASNYYQFIVFDRNESQLFDNFVANSSKSAVKSSYLR